MECLNGLAEWVLAGKASLCFNFFFTIEISKDKFSFKVCEESYWFIHSVSLETNNLKIRNTFYK